uniref:Uncharacterized protein n=1 Tax=Theropithecus gelada TaxID=9565 RepID=A0A8D2JTE5_THEGE
PPRSLQKHKNDRQFSASQLLGRLRWENGENPGGGACSEQRSYHCTPAWATQRDSVSNKNKNPDYFAKREQWKKLRRESWEREVKQLQEETPPGGPLTEALPPARKESDLPPLWWHIVTRPRERPTQRERPLIFHTCK